MNSILFEVIPGNCGDIGLISLNRPEVLNALNHEMIIMLHQKLLEWEEASNIKGVIIKAQEGRAFCAGGDLHSIYKKKQTNDPAQPNFFHDEYRLNHYIFRYPKPYIAFIDGITMGGGVGLSIHGSHRLGTENLLLAMPETGIGFFPDVGGTYILSRMPGKTGFYMGLSGARLNSDDCIAMNLINYKIAKNSMQEVIQDLIDTPFGIKAREGVSYILQKFNQPSSPSSFASLQQLIDQHFSKHTVEEIIASLENGKNKWEQETASILKKKSPISLKVTFRQLHEGTKRDFEQCMQLEHNLMHHFIQGHDFFEGIRALIIDKDNTPHWQPPELASVSLQALDTYFRPPFESTNLFI